MPYQLHFRRQPCQRIVHAHRTAHEYQRACVIRVDRHSRALVNGYHLERQRAPAQRLSEIAGSFAGEMTKNIKWFHWMTLLVSAHHATANKYLSIDLLELHRCTKDEQRLLLSKNHGAPRITTCAAKWRSFTFIRSYST